MQSDKGLCCPQTEALDTIECFRREQILGRTVIVQECVNPHILLMFEGISSLEAAQVIIQEDHHGPISLT